MNVLSLFDGMSCGQIALEKAGFGNYFYYASEIDKWAIKVTNKNYPETIQLGDVAEIDPHSLPKIDLLIGGSPCQGFSFSGKQLNFDDKRSALFFEFVRILKIKKWENPDLKFLLENVKMKQEYQDVISEFLGTEPVEINSGTVSAQNRVRLYWTNLKTPEFGSCEDTLKNVLEPKVSEKYYLSEKAINGLKRRKKAYRERGAGFGHNITKPFEKTKTILKRYYKDGKECLVRDVNGLRRLTPLEVERLFNVPDHYTDCVSDTQRYKMLGNGWTIDVIAKFFKELN